MDLYTINDGVQVYAESNQRIIGWQLVCLHRILESKHGEENFSRTD